MVMFFRLSILLTYLLLLTTIIVVSSNGSSNEKAEIEFHEKGSSILRRNNEQDLNNSAESEDDFSKVNEILRDIRMSLPDSSSTEDLGDPFGEVEFLVQNLVCYNMRLEDIATSYSQTDLENVLYKAEFVGIQVSCDLNWKYEYKQLINTTAIGIGILQSLANSTDNIISKVISGQGDAYIETSQNSIETVVKVISENFNERPPKKIEMPTCTSQVNVDDMDFKGKLQGRLLNTFERFFRGLVADLLEEELCKEIGKFTKKDLKKTVEKVHKEFEPYYEDLAPEDKFPLKREIQIQETTSANLLDLKNELPLNNYVHMGIEELDEYLGAYDERAETLEINKILRNKVLDKDTKALVLTPDDLGINKEKSSVIHHEESSIGLVIEGIVDEVRILGLDSVTSYDPVTIIGNQTLSTSVSVEYLDVEIDFTVDAKMKQAPGDNERHNNTNNVTEVTHVIEQPTALMRIKNIDLDLSFLLAVDEDELGQIQVGSMLNLDDIPPCLLSTKIEMGISNIKFQTGSYVPMEITNLISIGIDREVSNTMEAINTMYREGVLKTLPNIFATKVKSEGNSYLSKYIRDNVSGGCHDFLSNNNNNNKKKTIDFRDLLLQPKEAKALGGTGKSPYGDIPPLMKENFNTLINTPKKFGLTGLNEDVIVPLTNHQSNIKGTLVLPDSSFNGIDVTKISINNLDTLGTPIKILEPTNDPSILDSFLRFGSGKKHVEISLHIAFNTISKTIPGINLKSEESAQNHKQTKEKVNISLQLEDITLSVQTLLRISQKLFFEFSINQALDYNCWLALIADSASILDSKEEAIVAMKDITIELSKAKLNVECKSCNTAGTKQLPSIISSLQDVGAVNELLLGLSDFLSEFLQESGLIPSAINSYVIDAKEQCRLHHDMDNSGRRILQSDWQGSLMSFLGEDYQMNDGEIMNDSAIGEGGNSAMNVVTIVPNKPLIPRFSKESVEFLILFLSVVFHVVLVVRSLNYKADYDSSTFDALSGELSLLSSDHPNFFPGVLEDGLVDISEIADQFGERMNQALKKRSGKTDIYINEFVRDTFLNRDNAFVLVGKGSALDDMEKYKIDVGVSIALDSVRIKGFDTFYEVDVFNAIGRHTVRNHMSLKDLVLEAKFLITTNSQEEEMIIRLGIHDIHVDLSFLLAMNKAKLDGLELGSLLDTQHIFSCLLSTAHVIEVVHLNVDISDIHEYEITGFVSDATRDLLYNSSKAIVDLYQMDLSVVIESILQTLIVDELEKEIRKAKCPKGKTAIAKYVDFRELLLDGPTAVEYGAMGSRRYGDLALTLMNLINEELVKPNKDGWPKINENVIRKFFFSTSEEFTEKKVIDIGGRNKIIFSHLQISNLDSVTYPLVVLQPQNGSGFILENKVVIGGRERPMKMRFRITMDIEELGIKIYNELDFEIEMHDAGVFASFFAMVDESTFLQFPFGGLQNPHCWLTTIPVPVVDKYGVVTKESNNTLRPDLVEILWGNISLSFECVKCSSPNLEDLNSLNDFFSNMTEYLSTDHMDESFDRLHSVPISRLLTAPFVLDKIAQWQNQALQKCPSNNAGYTDGSSFVQEDEDIKYSHFSKVKFKDLTYKTLLRICIVIGGILILSLMISTFTKVRSVIKQKRWQRSISEHERLKYYRRQVDEEERWRNINKCTSSMMKSHMTIPLKLRLLIPVIIVGNIGLFLSGHLSLGATLNIQGLFAGQELVLDEPYFEFSMMQSTVDMWNAGVKELAVVLFIFSGIWPYVKQTICLFLWCCPPCCLSARTRGATLRWLDQFGKWSMVDIYIFYLSLVGFRMSVKSPAVATRFKDFYGLDILVQPLWGLYANLLAQLISQVSSHYMIYYHDKTVSYGDSLLLEEEEKAKRENNLVLNEDESELSYSVEKGIEVDIALEDSEKQQSLCKYCFEIPNNRTRKIVKANTLLNIWIFVVGLGTISLLFYGFFAASVELDFLGVVGIIMEAGIGGGEEAIVRHSQLSAIQLIMEQAKFINTTSQYFGLTTLCAVLLFTSLISPVCVTLILLYIWYWPMTQKKREKVLFILEVLQAWQYMEVYIISVVLGSWQLGGISELLLNDQACKNLDGLFASLFHYGVLGTDDAQCFYLKASICNAIYALIVAAFLLSWLTSFVLNAEEARKKQDKYQHQKEEHELFTSCEFGVEEADNRVVTKKKLKLAPVSFTERFGCLLVGVNESCEQSSVCVAVKKQTILSPVTVDTDITMFVDEEDDEESTESSLPSSILKYEESLGQVSSDLSETDDSKTRSNISDDVTCQ